MTEWTDFVSAVGNLATGAAAVFATLLARRGLSAWRDETIGRRRLELAEDVLADFYEARQIIITARNPWSWGEQGSSRPRQKEEGESLRQSRDAYFAPVERLFKHSEFFSKLNSRKYRVMATFGTEQEKLYAELFSIHNDVVFASEVLIEERVPDDEQKKARADLWRSPRGDDRLSKRLEKLVADVEAHFRPVVDQETKRRARPLNSKSR